MQPVETTIVLTTQRLMLRTWSPADADAVFKFWGDPEVMKYVEGGLKKDVESVRRGLAIGNAAYLEHGVSLWAVVERSSGRLVGDCGFHVTEDEPHTLELAYHFHSSAWGQGFATEAASACVNWALDTGAARKIVAYTELENIASERVLLKIGMTFQGMDEVEKAFAMERSGG